MNDEWKQYDRYTKQDLVKDVLLALVMLVVFLAYWCFVLAILSVVLLNVWHISWEQMLVISVGLTVVSEIVYIVRLVKKRTS